MSSIFGANYLGSGMTKQFESSRLKIQRAYKYIEELKAFFDSFLKTDFCHLVLDTDPNTGDQLIKVASVDSPPPEMSLIIGDVVHNLRSALDHAMVKIIGQQKRGIAFPLAKDQRNPGANSTYQLIKKTMPKLAVLLTDEIGIHDTGDLCLWAIGDLDNIDKHNLLIAVVSVQELRDVWLEDKAKSSSLRVGHMGVSQGPLVRYTAGQMEVVNKGQPDATILFGKGQPLEGKPIIPSLLKLAEITLQAIDTLELFWLGTPTS